MANRSYLVLTDDNLLYPSVVNTDFAPELQTIAHGVYCVPLLWFALFRPTDMRAQVVTTDSGSVEVIAPIAEVPTAIRQLEISLTTLKQMFASRGDLGDYVRLLHKGIVAEPRKYITIELDEIAQMGDPDAFFAYIRYALGAFAGDFPAAVGRTSRLKLSEIDEHTLFPPAECLINGDSVSDNEVRAHSQILGCSWIRPVPWE